MYDATIQASVKRLKEHAYNQLEAIPYDYVMKGNGPERISVGTGPAAGPSVVSLDSRRSNTTADNLEACQGTKFQNSNCLLSSSLCLIV